jgi:hypothetical protein
MYVRAGISRKSLAHTLTRGGFAGGDSRDLQIGRNTAEVRKFLLRVERPAADE